MKSICSSSALWKDALFNNSFSFPLTFCKLIGLQKGFVIMNEGAPEKSYQQALQEAKKRFEESLSLEVQKRVDNLPGITVEHLTANIKNSHLRRHTEDTLKFLKLAGCLRLLMEIEALDQEEREELDTYITTLHKNVHIDVAEEEDAEKL
jgi:hypothetical protein